MKELILHIGLPKTGSTTFQSNLRLASEQGLLQRVDYPLVDSKRFFEQVESGNGSHLGHYVRHTESSELSEQQIAMFLQSLESRRNFVERPLLISYEGFWTSSSENLDKFFSVLRESNYEISVVACVRNFPDFWRSALSQHVRQNYSRPNASETMREFIVRAKNWFGGRFPVTLVPYEKDVLANMFSAIGESLEKNREYPQLRLNDKLTYAEANLLGHLNDCIYDANDWFVTISNELRYQDEQRILRNPERQKKILEQFNEIQVPPEWEMNEAIKLLYMAKSNAKTDAELEFWQLLGQENVDTSLNLNNTPALLAVNTQVDPTPAEWKIAVRAVTRHLVDWKQHAKNLEQKLMGIDVQDYYSINSRQHNATIPKSQLYWSNLGFRESDYLVLNSDVDFAGVHPITHYLNFGYYENRKTVLKYRTTGIPSSIKVVLISENNQWAELKGKCAKAFNNMCSIHIDWSLEINPQTTAIVVDDFPYIGKNSSSLTKCLLQFFKHDETLADAAPKLSVSIVLGEIIKFEYIGLTSRMNESAEQFHNQFFSFSDEVIAKHQAQLTNVASKETKVNDATYGQSPDELVLEFLSRIFNVRKHSTPK